MERKKVGSSWAWKIGRHEHAGILEEAVTCRRNCVLCNKVVGEYDWKMLNICEIT